MVQIKKKMNVTNLFCKFFPEFLLSLAVKSFKEQSRFRKAGIAGGEKRDKKRRFYRATV
jgi:hypothetical protein